MNELTLPGVGPGIEAGMIAAVTATVFITGAMKGVLGLGLTTGSIVVFSLLYGVESALSLLIAPTIATNIWQGTTGGHGRELLGRFGIGIAAIVPGVWAGSLVVGGPHTDNAERVLGAVLVLYAFSAIARGAKGHYEPKREEMMTALAGALNGLVTGATGILVIPMIPYIERIKLDRDGDSVTSGAAVPAAGPGAPSPRTPRAAHPGCAGVPGCAPKAGMRKRHRDEAECPERWTASCCPRRRVTPGAPRTPAAPLSRAPLFGTSSDSIPSAAPRPSSRSAR